jgi:hypothetical protein
MQRGDSGRREVATFGRILRGAGPGRTGWNRFSMHLGIRRVYGTERRSQLRDALKQARLATGRTNAYDLPALDPLPADDPRRARWPLARSREWRRRSPMRTAIAAAPTSPRAPRSIPREL